MFDWDGFLELASELASRPDDESAHRTAISRAYYAAFHAGRAHLSEAGLGIVRTGRAHQRVRDGLGERDPELQQLLLRIHDWRKQADYDDDCSFDVAETALDAVTPAREIIDRIRSLL